MFVCCCASASDEERDQDSERDEEFSIVLNGQPQKLTFTELIKNNRSSCVLLANTADEQTYAVKRVLPSDLLSPFEHEEDEFVKREIDSLSKINSEFTVHVFGSVLIRRYLFIVMEYVPMSSLERALRLYSFSPLMRCRFMFDIARGMDCIHSHGVVHRDLRPESILVASIDPSSGVLCKVANFGKCLEDRTNAFTHICIDETPFYYAPETLLGICKGYTPAMNVYSFGIMCCELWNERDPYVMYNTFEFMKSVVEDGRRPDINDDCPKVLANLISQCWSAEKDDRPLFETIVETLATVVDDFGKSTPDDVEHVKLRKEEES